MLIPLERYVDEPEFRRLLLEHFPELRSDIEGDEGLIHMQMGALENLANVAIKAGDFTTLHKAYEFVSDLARHKMEIDSSITNAIHVSFLEGLSFENRSNGDRAKADLPPVLLEMWEAQMEHNRKIGWVKK